MSSKPDLADPIFRGARGAARAPAPRAAAPRRCASSARGTRRRRWRSARSRRGRSSPHTWIDLEDDDDVDVLLASMGLRAARHAGGDHADRGAAPPDTRRVRRAPRAHVPRRAGLHSSISSWWAAARPGSRPRCTARPRGSTPSRSTRWPSAARPARARASRTTSASRTASPAKSSRRGRDPGAAARRPARTRRARSRACASSTASTWSCSPTAARSRCRAVIVASGARYQRLAVDDLERFEGAGRLLRGDRSRGARSAPGFP